MHKGVVLGGVPLVCRVNPRGLPPGRAKDDSLGGNDFGIGTNAVGAPNFVAYLYHARMSNVACSGCMGVNFDPRGLGPAAALPRSFAGF